MQSRRETFLDEGQIRNCLQIQNKDFSKELSKSISEDRGENTNENMLIEAWNEI